MGTADSNVKGPPSGTPIHAAWLVGAFVLLLGACEGGGEDGRAAQVARETWGDLAEWPVAPEPELHIGVLDGDPNYQFFRASSAVRFPDGIIVVANAGTGQLRYFGADGEFLYSAGGRGGGPGEFMYMGRVYRQGIDSIMVYDRARRVSFFDRDGVFLISQNVRIDAESHFPMDQWLYRRNWVDGVPEGPGRASVARILDRLPPPVGEPGYRFVRADRAGNLWIADDIEPGGERAHWTVLDPTGIPVGRVTLPPRFEMLEVGDRDILGRWRDDSDVEYIRIHRLERIAEPENQPPTVAALQPAPAPAPALVADAGADSLILREIRSILRNTVTQQEVYFHEHLTYTANRHDLDWDLPEGILLDLLTASGTGWLGVVVHPDSPVICGIGLGSEVPPGWPSGMPKCAQTSVPAAN